MTFPASSSPSLKLTVVEFGADSFAILDSGATLIWTFPPIDDDDHGNAPSVTIRLTSTTSPLIRSLCYYPSEISRTTITATASPAAPTTPPKYVVSIVGFSKWRISQGGRQKRWTIPQSQAQEAFFELQVEAPTFLRSVTTIQATTAAAPTQQQRRAGSPSIQSAESPLKKKKRKAMEPRAKIATVYRTKQIKPIDDSEVADAYLKRHIKTRYPAAERNGHSAFQALIRALGLRITPMQLRLDLLAFMIVKRPAARKLLAGLTDEEYKALKHRVIPGGRMLRPEMLKERQWLDFARQCGPDHHFSDDLLPLVAHLYATIIACLSRAGSRESWSFLPEALNGRQSRPQVDELCRSRNHLLQVRDADADDEESQYACVELNAEEALPPISVWRLGDAKALTSVVRRASHHRCHKLYWFESRGTYKKAGTTECICKLPSKGPKRRTRDSGGGGGGGGGEEEGKGKGKAAEEEEEEEEEDDEGEESELTEED